MGREGKEKRQRHGHRWFLKKSRARGKSSATWIGR